MTDVDPPGNPPDDGPGSPSPSLWETVLERVREASAPRFEVERLLGYGGMADVYLAREPRLERHVAIKVMSPSLMTDPDLVKRFRHEALTIARLDHPNIITIYDVEERENLHYFVMAYVPGRTVGHVIKEIDGPLPPDVVRAWMYQVGSALDYAHGLDVVHRDVKPGNILLDGRGTALVTDFGIAKVADQEGLTRTGMLVGTPAYMSPEQCAGGEIGPASDQYSLGALAYQMLTGEPPFSGPTMAVLHAHMQQPPEPVRAIRPHCPPELADAVDRMLAKAPRDRWPSLGRALTAMDARPVGHAAPVGARLADLAAPVGRVTASSPRGVRRPPVPSDAVTPGETFVVEAVVAGSDGRVLSGRRVRWQSDAPDVARIMPDGRVVALGPGTARITARCGGVEDALVFTVAGDPGEEPVAVPPREVPVGTTIRLNQILPEGVPVSVGPDSGWGSSHPGVARTTGDGVLEAVRPGTATVTVFDQGRAALADVTVTPASGTEAGPSLVRASTPVPAAGPDRDSGTPTASTPDPDAQVPTPPAATPSASSPSATAEPPAGRAAPSSGPPTSWFAGHHRPLAWVGAGALVALLAVGGGVLLLGEGGLGGPEASSDPGASGAVVVGEEAQVEGPEGVATGTGASTEEPIGADPGPGDPAGADSAEGDPVEGGPVEGDPAEGAPDPVESATGAVRVAGLPAGARATVLVKGEDVDLPPGEALPLPPGDYTARVAAAGYEPYQGRITITAGETLGWRPALEARTPPPTTADEEPEEEPEPAEDMGPDPETLQAEARRGIEALVDAFARSFESRNREEVLVFFLEEPGAWASQWQPLVEDTGNARDLRASVGDLEALVLDGTDRASVRFPVRLEYRDFRNRLQNPVLEFRAVVELNDGSWRFRELTEGS